MGDYLGLIIAFAIGIPLLVLAVWADARRRRRLEGEADSPPERGDAEVDAHLPTYVTQSEIDAMPLPSKGSATPREHPGTKLSFGHAGVEFATDGDAAVLADARILMVDGEITSFREILTVCSTATELSPVAVVATGISDEVLQTLRANRRALKMHVVAAIPAAKDLYELRSLVGGEVLTIADVKAGYTPPTALGTAARWASTPTNTWVLATSGAEPEA